MWMCVISDIVLSSRAIAVEGPLSCPCSHKKCVVVWYLWKYWQPRINILIVAYVKIRMQMVHSKYRNMLPVLHEVFEAASLTTSGLSMYNDISFLSFSCLKHRKTRVWMPGVQLCMTQIWISCWTHHVQLPKNRCLVVR